MLKKYRRSIAVFCWLAAILLTIGSSHAYILRGPHVLDLMMRSYGKPRNMLVSQKVLFFGPGEAQTTEADETLRYVLPDIFRSDSKSENASRIHLMSKGESITVIDGKIAAAETTPFDLYKDMLLFRSRPLLQERLTALGIDMSVTAYGRFEDKIALVVGAERPDDPVPQAWFDKSTFLPIRWLVKNGNPEAQQALMEIRYSQWRQVGDVWYPMRVVFFQDEKPVREIRVETLYTNLTFPMDLFDMGRIRSAYKSAVPETKDAGVSGEISDIEKSIDEFRKKYE